MSITITDKAREAAVNEFSESEPIGHFVQQAINTAVEAATSELRAENAGLWQQLESCVHELSEENSQLRLDIAEIRNQHRQEANEWKTDEEVTSERDSLRSQLDAVTKERNEYKNRAHVQGKTAETNQKLWENAVTHCYKLREQLAQVTKELNEEKLLRENLTSERTNFLAWLRTQGFTPSGEVGPFNCMKTWLESITAERDAAQAWVNWLECKLYDISKRAGDTRRETGHRCDFRSAVDSIYDIANSCLAKKEEAV